MRLKIRILLVSLAAVMQISCPVFADSVSSSFTASGTPGNYELNFTFNNNMDELLNQSIYWVGVDLQHDSALAAPFCWHDNGDWNLKVDFPAQYGLYWPGSGTDYKSTWLTVSSYYAIAPYGSLEGFGVPFKGSSLPQAANFFAFSVGQRPAGAELPEDAVFCDNYTLGFEGIATSTPEPVSAFLFGIGGFILVLTRRKKQVFLSKQKITKREYLC